jgi:hypothetical protein
MIFAATMLLVMIGLGVGTIELGAMPKVHIITPPMQT